MIPYYKAIYDTGILLGTLLLTSLATPSWGYAQWSNAEHSLAGRSSPSLFQTVQERFPYLRYRGHLKTDVSLKPKHTHGEGRYLDSQTQGFVETTFDLTDWLVAVGSARFDYYLSHDGGTDTLFESRLHEAYADISMGNLAIRIGKQIVVWGKTDIISPLDNLNPLDLRYVIDPLPETMKLPILMAKVDYSRGDWTLEGVYIPFFQSSVFEMFGSDFSLLKHSFPELHFGGILGWFEHVGWIRFPQLPSPDAMDPHLRVAVNDLLRATEYPRDNFLEGDYGLALKGTWKGLDLEVSYLYAWDDLPSYWLNPALASSLVQGTLNESTIVELLRLAENGDYSSIAHGTFCRMHVAGTGLSRAWKQYTFRAEGAYIHKRTFYTTMLEPRRSSVLFYVVGADYTFRDKYLFHVQGFHHRLLEADRSIVGINRDTYGLTTYVTAFFMDATLVSEWRLVYLLDTGDFFLNPRITYAITDHVSVSCGAHVFEGRGPKKLRSLSDLIRLTPLSYVSDNDTIFFTLKYAF